MGKFAEPFVAKGAEPEWQMIFKVLIHMEPGQIIDYDMLDKVLGRPFLDSRTPVYRAKAELLNTHGLLLRNVSGVGYQIAAAEEYEGVARGYIREGHRKIVKAKDLTEKTPLGDLTAAQRKSVVALRNHLVAVAKATGALNRKVEGKHAVDAVLDAVRQESEATAPKANLTTDEVAAKLALLEERIERFNSRGTAS